MHRLTAAILLALFWLIPAAPLWGAPSSPDDPCCPSKKGMACCRKLHLSHTGPRLNAAPSCGDCLRGTPGVQAPVAVLPSTRRARKAATVQANSLPRPELLKAGSSYLAFLYQRPPPVHG